MYFKKFQKRVHMDSEQRPNEEKQRKMVLDGAEYENGKTNCWIKEFSMRTWRLEVGGQSQTIIARHSSFEASICMHASICVCISAVLYGIYLHAAFLFFLEIMVEWQLFISLHTDLRSS